MPMRSADYRRMLPPRPGTGSGDLRALSQMLTIACLGAGLAIAASALSGCAMVNDQFKGAQPAPVPDPKQHVATDLPNPKQRPKPPVTGTREHDAPPAATPDHDPPPPAKVASIDPNRLVGLDPPAVEKVLGAPTNVSRSDPSLVWTYVGSGCSFQIIFYPDIKTTTFHALKFLGSDSAGGRLDNSHACIRNILTARNYGPA